MAGKDDQVQVNIDGDEIFFELNKTPQVRAAVRKRAQAIATRAMTIDKAENGGKARIRLVDKKTGRGRVVTEVHSDDGDGEYGTSKTKRRRTLRRAMGGR